MANGFEQTTILGTVGRDAEMRHTQSGSAVTNFSVAVSTSWFDKATNEKREKTKWYKVVCWNKLAEAMGGMIKKGMTVHVVGECDAKAYMGQDGEIKPSLELTTRNIQIVNWGKNNDSGSNSQQSQQQDNDIPF